MKMKLTVAEKKVIIKLLENTIERFEPEDLIHMIRGPKYKMILDRIYDEVFRPHIKYDVSVLEDGKEADDKESEVLRAIWKKLSDYLLEELDEN